MKKEDLVRWTNQFRKNESYFQENEALLNQPTYQQELRRDRLTTLDKIKAEFIELTQKQKEDEETKKRMGQSLAEAEAREREEFENWKKSQKDKEE